MMSFFKRRQNSARSAKNEQDSQQEFWLEIRTKIEQLNRMDQPAQSRDRYGYPERKVFGASMHRYEMGFPWSGFKIAALERKYGIELPKNFKSFLRIVGSPAGGPGYGIEDIGKTLKDLKHRDFRKPSKITPDSGWVSPFDESDPFGPLWDDDSIFHGMLYLGTEGCGIDNYLVLNGPGRGHVFTDGDMAGWRGTLEEFYGNWIEKCANTLEASEKP